METVPSVIAKPLKIGVAAFFVALATVVAAFIIDYQADNILAYVFFWIVSAAVLVGFVCIAWGIWAVVHNAGKNQGQNNA